MNRQIVFVRMFLALFLLAAGLLISATAQGNSYGYVFAAPGVTSPGGTGTLHIGGGGEAMFDNGAGLSAEAGYVSSFRNFSGGVGLFSVNGSYHFLS